MGAQTKLQYHEGRLRYWQGEREIAKEAVQHAGFKVVEYEVTGGKDVQVQVDPAPVQRLNQCNMKIREHQPKIKEYRQWVATLATQLTSPPTKIDLTMEDALYFGLAKEDPID
jgi:hypothetical protein